MRAVATRRAKPALASQAENANISIGAVKHPVVFNLQPPNCQGNKKGQHYSFQTKKSREKVCSMKC